ncbi:MAG TPA: L,D-transpeptidase [Pyrinomonadaceae bacterium]|nr:L,D-transpeptidase [Pyrinomonadaceae bacterium]
MVSMEIVIRTSKKLTLALVMVVGLVLLAYTDSYAITAGQRTKGRSPRAHARALTRAEMKHADARLAEMGYGKGRIALIAFQKYEGRRVTGRLSRADVDRIMNTTAPVAKDAGYKHVEVDLDRQVLLLTDADGVVRKVLPVSTGSNKNYKEKGMSGLAYTPRGRFRIYAKISGWRKSPLGMLYYPNYFSDGLAIHGNSSVPDSPQSHGCIRIPNSAAIEMSRQMPVGTIVLIYDSQGFVSAKEWAEADKQKTVQNHE